MRLEDILKKFLPSTVSPKSFETIVINFEQIGKICAGFLALFYVVGIIIFGLYYSSLNVRSIELFKVRYLFVGFYYITFMFLLLAYPYWWMKRLWTKIVYLIVLFGFIIFLDRVNNIFFMSFLLQKLITGTSHFQFKPAEVSIIVGNIIMLIILYISSLILSIILFYYIKTIDSQNHKGIVAWIIFFIIIINYAIFAQFVFPYIPDAIGGGKSPIVNIVFKKDVPYEITSNFDIGGKTTLFTSPYYYARLIYLDNDSIFLKEPFWYSNQVYELQRSDIEMIKYREFNPVEVGSLENIR